MHATGSQRDDATDPGRLAEHVGQRVRRPSQIYRPIEAPVESASRGRYTDRALIGVFLCAITLPAIGMVTGLDSKHTLEENRRLAGPPKLRWNWTSMEKFPASAEAYFNDHFGFRTRLIQGLNLAKVAGLGVSPTPRVILGANGWLFYGDVDLPYFRAVEPLSHAQLLSWQRLFERRRDWLAAWGIKYLVVFAANKSTIYPELMPPRYNRLDHPSRLDQLMAHLREHSSLKVVDLRPALLEKKRQEQVYYRTDSHWNYRGAHAGYSAIMTGLSAWFPELRPVPRSAFREQTHREPGRDLSMLLNLRDYFRDEFVDLNYAAIPTVPALSPTMPRTSIEGPHWTGHPDVAYENPGAAGPRVVFFHDSFGSWLMPFFSGQLPWIRFSWQYSMNHDIVDMDRPDVVIQEMVERTLAYPAEGFLEP